MSSQLPTAEECELPYPFVTVHIGGSTFTCDMNVLRSKSKYFRRCSDHQAVIHFQTEDVPPAAFAALYEWMEGKDELEFAKKEALDNVKKASSFLKIERLMEFYMHQHKKQMRKGEAALERLRRDNL